MNISLYTDGACSGNPGRGGWAAVAIDENGNTILSESCGYRKTTNNRMEIQAVAEGLITLFYRLTNRDTDIKVTVYSDSQLVVNTINLGWARKTNGDLWGLLDSALNDCRFMKIDVTFEKVKGHSGNKYNEMVDKMAVEASTLKGYQEIDTVYETINPFEENAQKENDEIEAMINEYYFKHFGAINDPSRDTRDIVADIARHFIEVGKQLANK